MNESEWDTIYNNLSLKDTEELIGYWQKQEKQEWTAIAFDVMEKILIERLGVLPGKNEIEKELSTNYEPKRKTNAFDELKTLILDNEPVFYDPNKITLLVKWIFRCMNLLIILYCSQFIIDNIPLFRVIFFEDYGISSLIIDLFFSIIVLLITTVVIFIQYKVMGYVLKILREMEFNSRKK
ncbi:MAG TPA: hypothetical protein DIW44_09990 [Anaerolineaceae bacterium]|nr:hypothetical protein [Anaerolineaceae bacterium]